LPAVDPTGCRIASERNLQFCTAAGVAVEVAARACPEILAELVPLGILRFHVSPLFSRLPPPTGMAAGHTVKEHRLVMLKEVALAPAARAAARRRMTAEEEAAIDLFHQRASVAGCCDRAKNVLIYR
jgi:hypothetical protein